MALTVDELLSLASKRCEHLKINLIKEKCGLCQPRKSKEVKFLSSLSEIVPDFDIVMDFAIKCEWTATFTVVFAENSEMRVLDYYINLSGAENVHNISLDIIREKGERTWGIIMELIENDP